MWLSIFGIVMLMVLSGLFIIVNHSWASLKALPSELKHDLKEPESDEQNIIIQIVGFSKLWFRKQFALIDKELAMMDKNLMRTGLIAVREEYSEEDATQTLNWQIEGARQQRQKNIAMIEALSSNLLPIALLISVCTLIIQLSANTSASAGIIGMPALIVLAFALFMNALVLKALSHKLYAMLELEDHALRLSAEGLIMILQHKTPAQVRAQLEGMTNGLEVIKNVRPVEAKQPAQNARQKNTSFFSGQRAS
jgi:hypothetical protein